MKKINKTLRRSFLERVKEEVCSYGWSNDMLFEVEKKLGLDKNYHVILFPEGIREVVGLYEKDLDEEMSRLFLEYNHKHSEIKVRDKVKLALQFRLEAANKTALSQLKQFYFSVQNFSLGVKNNWRTVDAIWSLAGDTATDYNYYTKRGLLFTIYRATFLHYVTHDNPEYTWELLDKKIANVMKINKIKKIPQTLKRLKDKLPFC